MRFAFCDKTLVSDVVKFRTTGVTQQIPMVLSRSSISRTVQRNKMGCCFFKAQAPIKQETVHADSRRFGGVDVFNPGSEAIAAAWSFTVRLV